MQLLCWDAVSFILYVLVGTNSEFQFLLFMSTFLKIEDLAGRLLK